MNEPTRRPKIVLGVIGAAVGGYVGFLAFNWMVSQGFYALILPAGLLGGAAGYCAKYRSIPLAIGCGLAGLAFGLFTEWNSFPFKADKSFLYFVTHAYQLKPLTLIMLVIGTIISYRLALGMDRAD